MSENEKEVVRKINIDKAKNKTIISIILITISISTYLFAIIFGKFDFGMIFKVASLAFLLIARIYIYVKIR